MTGRVTDSARMLSPAETERIESRLEELERSGGPRMAILIVDSLGGEPVEVFALRVAETWKIGRRGVDDGVLLLVARAERELRLEVGYGLEAALTDALSRRILAERVAPMFRAGRFAAGLERAVDAVRAAARGERMPASPPAALAATEVPLGARVTAAAIFALVIGAFSLVALLGPHGFSWVLGLFLVPFYALFPAAIVHPRAGIVSGLGWLVGFPLARVLLRRSGLGASIRTTFPSLDRLASTGGRGGIGGGRRLGGGGSGGGGRFGGGGASGGW